MADSSENPIKVSDKPLALSVAALLVPGLGHLLSGRVLHAAIFGSVVYALFAVGMAMSNGTAIDPRAHPVFWIFQHAAGLPTLIVGYGELYNEARIGDNVEIRQQGIGLAYVAIAGLCNVIAITELWHRAIAGFPESENDAGEAST